jgi:hypothetical protein
MKNQPFFTQSLASKVHPVQRIPSVSLDPDEILRKSRGAVMTRSRPNNKDIRRPKRWSII